MFKVCMYYEAQEEDPRFRLNLAGDTFTVYAVQNDSCGYPMFLFRCKKQWVWKSAKHFFPID